jgi:hydroxymethylbilane synthase
MTNTKNIFISREINDEAFKQYIKDKDVVMYAQSLVGITPIDIKEVPETEWIFFYSKNGIKHFFSQKKVAGNEAILKRKFAVMGNGSSTLLKQIIGKDADYIASSDIQVSVNDFWKLVTKENVLFIKASNSLSSFEQAGKETQTKSIEVYSNFISESKNIPPCEIAAFTSPMNAKAFAQSQSLMKVKSIIAIGESTQDALMELAPGKEILTVKEPSEKAILLYIRFLLK